LVCLPTEDFFVNGTEHLLRGDKTNEGCQISFGSFSDFISSTYIFCGLP